MGNMMPSGYWWRHLREQQTEEQRKADDDLWAELYGPALLQASLQATEWVLELPFPPSTDPDSLSARAAREEAGLWEKHQAEEKQKNVRKMARVTEHKDHPAIPDIDQGQIFVMNKTVNLWKANPAKSCSSGGLWATKPPMPTRPPPMPTRPPPMPVARPPPPSGPLPTGEPPAGPDETSNSAEAAAGTPVRPGGPSQPAASKGPPAALAGVVAEQQAKCKGPPAALAGVLAALKSKSGGPPGTWTHTAPKAPPAPPVARWIPTTLPPPPSTPKVYAWPVPGG